MIFGVLNPEETWHHQLVQLPTSPVYCSHCTLGNPKSHFSIVLFIHTSYYLRYLKRKQTVAPLPTIPEQCHRTILWNAKLFQLISGKKDWKHASVQKVVTFNTCCDVACLTFQLPHITTGSSFQSHQCHTTTDSFQSHQRFEEHNITFIPMKKFSIYKVVW